MKINNDIFKKYLTDNLTTDSSAIALSARGGRRLYYQKIETNYVYPSGVSRTTITINSFNTDKACIFFFGADNDSSEPTIGAIRFTSSGGGVLKVLSGNTKLTLTSETTNNKIMYLNTPKYSNYTFIWNAAAINMSVSGG